MVLLRYIHSKRACMHRVQTDLGTDDQGESKVELLKLNTMTIEKLAMFSYRTRGYIRQLSE